MAMDFFESQEVARRKTGRLVFLYGFAVFAIIVMTYVVVAGALFFASRSPRDPPFEWIQLYDPGLLLAVTIGTALVIGLGSLSKTNALRAGGTAIAERLGGRPVSASTSDFAEKRLLNVVEEMAIASGTPVPLVYVLEGEKGINAFAAGFSSDDAVIGVTRATAESLTRAELEGVIAHEFSHILNGDMRLNLRLIGVLHGILVLGMIGYFLLRSMAFRGGGRKSDSNRIGAVVILIGIGIWVIGSAGTFCGNLIKAAVSRQREFLADASAVQFTRDPGGIAGALKKIGGLVFGSRLENPNAPEASHMYFSQGVRAGFLGMYATHPPLAERIRRLDPSWDGAFPQTDVAAAEEEAGVAGFAAREVPAARTEKSALQQIGRPTEVHRQRAALLLATIPRELHGAARDPWSARAIIHALLLGESPTREAQLAHLAEHADPGLAAEVERLAPRVAQVPARARIALIDLTLPSLRRLSPSQSTAFRENVAALVHADDVVDGFEWVLLRILRHRLEPTTPAPVRYHHAREVIAPISRLLSVLAWRGHRSDEAARRAFEAAGRRLELARFPLHRRDDWDPDALDRAIDELDQASPPLKREILAACATCIEEDRQVTEEESELFRAIGDSLGCPVPPVLPGQSLGAPASVSEA